MEQRFVMLLMTALAVSVSAQQNESADTLLVADKAEQVTVASTENGVVVTINNYDGKATDYIYSSQVTDSTVVNEEWILNIPGFVKKTRRNKGDTYAVSYGIYMGFINTFDTPDNLNLAAGRSIEWGMLNLLGWEYRPWRNGPRWSAGLGFGFKSYRTHKGGTRFYKNSDGDFVVDDYPDDTYGRHSRLQIFHLNVPLMMTQRVYRGWGVRLGAVFNFNLHASANSCYDYDGIEVKESYKRLQQRKVTVDFMAAAGLIGSFAVYVKYSPVSVMKSGCGPEIKSFSFGVMLPM